jgi:soluble lytic murein transglycosylase-like protein
MRFGNPVLTALVLLGAAFPASAQIYAGRDARGTVVLSDFASEAAAELLIAAPAAFEAQAVAALPPPKTALHAPVPIAEVIERVARATAMSPQLLHAVIAVESAYDARAVSPKGAQGLMQLTPATAQRFGVGDPFDPSDNVRGGALYLKWLLQLFGGDLALALAAYNAGEHAVIRAGYRIPPFPETQRYVPRVLARLQRPVRG